MDYKYKLAEDGVSIIIEDGDQKFNRGMKRGDTILVTGDKPCFALMRALPEDKTEPGMVKLGDARIRIICFGVEEWLDNATCKHTTFTPFGAEYNLTFDLFPGIEFNYLVTLAEDWGAVASIAIKNSDGETNDMGIDIVYGGLTRTGRTFSAPYFKSDLVDTKGNEVVIEQHNLISISAADVPEVILLKSVPFHAQQIKDKKAVFSYNVHLEQGERKVIHFIAGRSASKEQLIEKLSAANPEELINKSIKYYKDILSKYKIFTPDDLINSGFTTAILNLEYDYNDPAWFEGVHWWSAYWNNSFQISAAISLGQRERAKKALEFFSKFEGGPGCIVNASGSANVDGDRYHEGWLPYYLHELIQYYEMTGDRILLEEIWDKVVLSLERLWRVRDLNCNGLLDWHLHCNSFMYQADHISMPGDAASPSLIMAGLLERLSDIAGHLGKEVEAGNWRIKARNMYIQLEKLLWNAEEGFFYNHVDLQGIKHMAHYYTDLVFPVLYSGLPLEYGWQSMKHLTDTLWVDSIYGKPLLMRVGDFKPSIFGNDNVMPAQMCEAARAYFKVGDVERGTRLLASVALAGTIFTDAPGNFPERMDHYGKGKANYIFGNPIGSFIYTLIDGLYGISVINGGRTVRWAPAFPQEWGRAEMQLPYCGVAYKRFLSGGNVTREYTLTNNNAEGLDFILYLEPCRIKTVSCNGKIVKYSTQAGLGKLILEMSEIGHKEYVIVIEYTPVAVTVTGPGQCRAGSDVCWENNIAVQKISDPQQSLKNVQINGNNIHAGTGKNTGRHQIFAEMGEIGVIYPICFEIKPDFVITNKNAVYDTTGKTLILDTAISVPEVIQDKAVIVIKILDYEWKQMIDLSYCTDILESILIPNVGMLFEGIYEISYSIYLKEALVYEAGENVRIHGKDRDTDAVMCRIRDDGTEALDLYDLYNTTKIFATSCWRYCPEFTIDIRPIISALGMIITEAGEFKIPADGDYLALIEYGTSDPYTGAICPADRPSSLTVNVNRNVQMLSMLFASEVASRHTGCTVGLIRLTYEDGSIPEIPLISGKNIDSLFSHYAKDTIPVKLGEVDEADRDAHYTDYLNVLSIPCNQKKVLNKLEVQIDVPDVQLGLMGVNVTRVE